jgi:hypothetical protein
LTRRTSGDLDAVHLIERAERQATAIQIEHGQLLHPQHSDVRQHCIQRDGVMAGRQHETIALRPIRPIDVVTQLPKEDHSQRIGNPQLLSDVTLSNRGRGSGSSPFPATIPIINLRSWNACSSISAAVEERGGDGSEPTTGAVIRG